MGIIDFFLRPIRAIVGWLGSDRAGEAEEARRRKKLEAMREPEQQTDGHAPGHRHLGPPPEQAPPRNITTEGQANQPWVRRSQSDSQQRRPRG